MATDELAKKLERRCNINEGVEEGSLSPQSTVYNPFTEFKEFSRKQIQDFQKTFKKYDINGDKFIDFEELKHMMEQLKAPQTHLSLKAMIREVDEDNDSKISFREFLLIFHKAAAGELEEDSGLSYLYRNVSEIDVDKEGVKGAKNFFTAKIEAQTVEKKLEKEIKEEQEQRKKEAEEAKVRKAEFKNKAQFFVQQADAQLS